MGKYIVDIDEEIYQNIMNGHGLSPYGKVFRAIQDSIPLKKYLENINTEIETEKMDLSNKHYLDWERGEAYNCGIQNAIDTLDEYINNKDR